MGVLDGKAVVVTGAGRGLGRAFALHAANSGAAVVVNDIDEVESVVAEIEAFGGRTVAGRADVTDPDQVRALIDLCVTEFGAIDGLVNNAGLRHMAPPWEETPEAIRALIEVNVIGAMYCGTVAAQAMHAQRSGAIVNIGSLAMLGQRTTGTYSASKGAIASMTVSWAVDLEPFGVRVNALCPLAWTRMAVADPLARTNPADTPDKMAPMVTFLLSDLAAGVTGQIIRFADTLHIVQQPARKPPVLTRDRWEVTDIAAAFESLSLEAFPGVRWPL
ncbi:SDR family oxidoreductase [Actinocrispum sp. NPDC049592]|uniref:SDR family NAD(P)-dependent oxidoreductase n=1 Tax=Actinocrispum sp. NPDC049592 TaxID=3154835 RepID=UPI00343A0490